MKHLVIGTLLCLTAFRLHAQRSCSTAEYQDRSISSNPLLANKIDGIEKYIAQQKINRAQTASRGGGNSEEPVIVIPVVFHIVYHHATQNVKDADVHAALDVLNKAFRRLNADTANTPERFRGVAADVRIEFKLATSDPRRRTTTGITRKYSPISSWIDDDQVKSAEQMGSPGWNSENYLNVWVCDLKRLQGYASFPGGDPTMDGVVIDYAAFQVKPAGTSEYQLGKTLVHEVGHWLGLRHIWGDNFCGDDLVDDTPKQGTFTTGCPSGIRSSCGNNPNGDMFVNYMDLSSDACMNMFTQGQKNRMRDCLSFSGPRHTLSYSPGLLPPLFNESPVEEEAPRWLHPQIYPNPVRSELVFDLSYDVRWVGKTLLITNLQGQTVSRFLVSGKIQTLDVSRLSPGIYFIHGKKEDGQAIKHKFVKM